MYLAKTFTGWTLDYIDSLSIEEITRLQAILDGMNRYEEKASKMRSKGMPV